MMGIACSCIGVGMVYPAVIKAFRIGVMMFSFSKFNLFSPLML
jgi:hypothetical protein